MAPDKVVGSRQGMISCLSCSLCHLALGIQSASSHFCSWLARLLQHRGLFFKHPAWQGCIPRVCAKLFPSWFLGVRMCSSGESGLLPLQSSMLPGWIALQLLEERSVLGETEVGTVQKSVPGTSGRGSPERVSQHLKKKPKPL